MPEAFSPPLRSPQNSGGNKLRPLWTSGPSRKYRVPTLKPTLRQNLTQWRDQCKSRAVATEIMNGLVVDMDCNSSVTFTLLFLIQTLLILLPFRDAITMENVQTNYIH